MIKLPLDLLGVVVVDDQQLFSTLHIHHFLLLFTAFGCYRSVVSSSPFAELFLPEVVSNFDCKLFSFVLEVLFVHV